MRVAQLDLTNFRNHTKLIVPFEAGVSTIIGRNGRGKTNIVEAVNYLATLSSHRVATDLPLIQREHDQSTIQANIVKNDRAAEIAIEINSGKQNKVTLNGSRLSRARDVLGLVHTIIFAPEDLDLVKGDPSSRRKFLDDFLIQVSPAFAGVKSDYERVVKQRNSLLKSLGRRTPSGTTAESLKVWDEQLISLGALVVSKRLDALKQLSPFVENHGDVLSNGTEPMKISYESSWWNKQENISDIEDALRENLENRSREEVERGLTLVGPHRDDILLSLSDWAAKGYASHGQSWSFALALRLATFDVLRQFDDDPILILDDVFAELDQARRNRLIQAVQQVEQTIVTAAVAEDVPHELISHKILLEELA